MIVPTTLCLSLATTVTHGWKTVLDRYKKGYDTREKMGQLTFSDLEVHNSQQRLRSRCWALAT